MITKTVLPKSESHKGQNGKLLIIGGSELFHAPLLWSAEVASRVVDMVHVTSPVQVNSRLMREKLQQKFWNGIVIPYEKIDEYIMEDDCILIGPGMPRKEGLEIGETSTKEIVDGLLKKYPGKRWVVDGGALQEVDHNLLNGNMIITPHQREWERLLLKSKLKITNDKSNSNTQIQNSFSMEHDNLTILLKGRVDIIIRGKDRVKIEGGNEGMTKGGTGDVLAGLVAALATKNDLWVSAQAASRVNKLAGDSLRQKVGNFYNATDLVNEIPQIMHEIVSK